MAKYLIGNNFKALRTGEFVQASHEDGEFIYDTDQNETDQLAVATLIEVAEANGLKISSKAKKADVIEQLSAHLSTLKLPEVNKMTDTQIVEKVIEAGVAAGKSDDDMLLEIVNEGVSFKSATKLFKSVMEEKGYRVNAKERAEKIEAILKGEDFAPETADEVKEMVDRIVSEVPDTSDKQALAAIRKYAKANEIELPKVKKGGGSGGAGTSGINKKVGEFLLENRDADEAAVQEFIKSIKEDVTDGQLKKYTTNAMRMLAFAKQWSGE